mgnify:CR=1 FL=1
MLHIATSKTRSVLLATFLAALAMAALAMAPRAASAQDKGFGLGVVLGDPSGLSFKGYIGPTAAIDGALGLGFLDAHHIAAYIDFLWEWQLASWNPANLALYLGVGPKVGRFSNHEHHQDHRGHDEVRVGARAPVGVAFQFRRAPVDAFVEIAAGLWVADHARFDLDAGFGVRYWF